MIFDDLQKVYELAIAYIGNGRFFAFAVASMLFFFVASPKSRVRFIYPILLVLLVIGTPWLYHFVFNRDAYWRTFWMFPGGILIALYCVRLIQVCEKNSQRVGMTVFLLFILFFLGTNMYAAVRVRSDRREESILMVADNPEKVSGGVKRVADLLLSIEDRPKVVSRKKYIYELRQYSSKIELYYGRDIDGFIIPILQKNGWRQQIHKQLESSSPNYNRILRMIDEAGYNFLITSSAFRINEKTLDKYGYHEIAIMDGSAVYYKENPKGSSGSMEEGAADSASQSIQDESIQDESLQDSLTESAANAALAEPDDSAADQAADSTAENTEASLTESEDDRSAEKSDNDSADEDVRSGGT